MKLSGLLDMKIHSLGPRDEVTFRYILKHFLMFLTPAASGIITCIFLEGFRKFGLQIPEGDEAIVLTWLQVVGGFHAITIGWLLYKILKELSIMRDCVIDLDEVAFRKLLRHRIPLMVHLLVSIMTAFLVIPILSLHYESVWTGRMIVFMATFLLVFYFKAAIVLDDPCKAPWLLNTIPNDWIARIMSGTPPLVSAQSALQIEKDE